MKKVSFISIFGCSLAMTACSHIPFVHHKEKKIGMPNPASEYCIQQGGKLRHLKDAFGNEFNNCKLPNGQEQNEWDLYRQTHQDPNTL